MFSVRVANNIKTSDGMEWKGTTPPIFDLTKQACQQRKEQVKYLRRVQFDSVVTHARTSTTTTRSSCQTSQQQILETTSGITLNLFNAAYKSLRIDQLITNNLLSEHQTTIIDMKEFKIISVTLPYSEIKMEVIFCHHSRDLFDPVLHASLS